MPCLNWEVSQAIPTMQNIAETTHVGRKGWSRASLSCSKGFRKGDRKKEKEEFSLLEV
jgi:hypothetical protein